ncbi:DUF3987 domain-containing protein [Paraburkholderia gardini]|uniref:DUF3987 domain-containing protein n=1 Tax=Paraburkholderia gardini TaxID=2823469 RepID=A0ABM8UA75_9BURK|nr:DUF3987 domain-containing protein [Paraburkholderia gardini]CAG4920417.1 hypothetical protein R54767_04713 [Paraburkholderia gardini]
MTALEVVRTSTNNARPLISPFPGPMESLVSISMKHQHRLQPALTVGAALAAMSACMHGRWALDDGLRGNLYIAGLAGTGSGKDGPLKLIETLAEVGGGQAVSNIGSGQGIEDSLCMTLERRLVLCVDELAHLIGAISGNKAASYQTAAEKMLLELFSRSGSSITTRTLARRPSITLYHPYVTLFGVTTHAKMRGIPASLIETGFLGRCLLVDGEDFPPPAYPVRGDLYSEIESALGATARSVSRFGSPMTRPEDDVQVVPRTSQAMELEREAGDAFYEGARSADATRRALCMRALEMAKRIALVLAVWDDVQVVTPDHLEWGVRFVRYSHACLSGFTDSMTDSQVVRDARKIEQTMRDAISGKRPFTGVRFEEANNIAVDHGLVSHSALLKKSRLDSATFGRCIKHLESEGAVAVERHQRSTRGGPSSEVFYVLPG